MLHLHLVSLGSPPGDATSPSAPHSAHRTAEAIADDPLSTSMSKYPSSQSVAGCEPMPTRTRSASRSEPSLPRPFPPHLRHRSPRRHSPRCGHRRPPRDAPGNESPDALTQDRRQRRRLGFDEDDPKPSLETGRNLTADEAGPHDHRPMRGDARSRNTRVVHRTQAGRSPGGRGIRTWPLGPGSDHELVVAECRPVRRVTIRASASTDTAAHRVSAMPIELSRF